MNTVASKSNQFFFLKISISERPHSPFTLISLISAFYIDLSNYSNVQRSWKPDTKNAPRLGVLFLLRLYSSESLVQAI